MRITYDQNVDAIYIRFKEATVTTKHLGEGIAADLDAEVVWRESRFSTA